MRCSGDTELYNTGAAGVSRGIREGGCVKGGGPGVGEGLESVERDLGLLGVFQLPDSLQVLALHVSRSTE